ncbi:hypothetical protein AKAW_11455 [Aspergillus luchuensis IFO 4308]|nr:hypothetical protein AKAW_11455 [Aspergillus luchuensis IFO 4308]
MSRPFVDRPETPIFQPTVLPELHPSVLSEYADPPSDSSASTPECPCCASPPLPDLEPLSEAILDRRLDSPGLPSTLEGQFLDSVSLLPAAESSAQAAAMVSQDAQANGHWLLVTLLCHRVFDACGDRAEFRYFSISYYRTFGPGDVLTAVSRKVIQVEIEQNVEGRPHCQTLGIRLRVAHLIILQHLARSIDKSAPVLLILPVAQRIETAQGPPL